MNVVGASLLAINPVANHKPSLAGKLLQKKQKQARLRLRAWKHDQHVRCQTFQKMKLIFLTYSY